MSINISDPIEFEKNIATIDFYAEEEKQVLKSIYISMNTMENNYKSINNNKFQNNITSIDLQIPKIYNKRANYAEILRKVLSNYEQQTKQHQQAINKLADNINDIVNTINKEV